MFETVIGSLSFNFCDTLFPINQKVDKVILRWQGKRVKQNIIHF